MIKLFRISVLCCFSILRLSAGEMLDYEQLSRLPVLRLFQLSETYKDRNRLDTAMGYYIVLAGKYQYGMNDADKYLCVKACNEVGKAYYSKGNYTKAFDFFMQGIKYAEENSFYDLLASLYNNVGNIYCIFGDVRLGIEKYEKGLELACESNDREREKTLLMNLSGVCGYTGQKDKAVKYDRMMMAKFRSEDNSIEYYSYFNKGILLTNDSNYVLAADYMKQAVNYARNNHLSPEFEASAYGKLADLYMKMSEKSDSAFYYLRKNYAFAQQYGLTYIYRGALKLLVIYYNQQQNRDSAMYYKVKYWELSDSLFSYDDFNRMKNERFLYELDQNYQKIKTLYADREEKESQIRRSRIQLICVSAAMIVFILLMAFAFLQKRRLKYAYIDIFNRNAEILRAEEESRKKRMELEDALRLERQTASLLQKEKNGCADTSQDIKPIYQNGVSEDQRELIQVKLEHVMANSSEFCDCDFTVNRLSELVGSNSRYVSQVINETYGKNFRAFINEYRIKEAQRRLMNVQEYGNYTIKAIAESVGYKSHTGFIELFKKYTGITPSMFQQLAKEKCS